MIGNERAIATGLVGLLLAVWLGFLLHVDPRWPGSLFGSMVGIAAAVLLQAPFVYLVVKRVAPLRRWVTRRVPMSRLLTWHIHAGILGPLLGVLHSGHKFDSALGTALVALMLVVVLSGFTGRYLLARVAHDIADKSAIVDQLQAAYAGTAAALQPQALAGLRRGRWLFALPFGGALAQRALARRPAAAAALHTLAIAGAIADTEASIAADALLRALFAGWLRLHLAMALMLQALLALHVWSSVYFGLRWL
jgi:hypothetical protein